MDFITGKKYGQYWEDAKLVDRYINTFNFYQTGKDETYFESILASHFDSHRNEFKTKLRSQRAGDSKVDGVDCFGKKHRPDIAFSHRDTEEGIIALEVKYATYGKLAKGIGQCMVYRLKFRFVFLVLVLPPSTTSEKGKRNRINVDKYCSIYEGNDEEFITLGNILKENNIFIYLAPAFKTDNKGVSKIISFF